MNLKKLGRGNLRRRLKLGSWKAAAYAFTFALLVGAMLLPPLELLESKFALWLVALSAILFALFKERPPIQGHFIVAVPVFLITICLVVGFAHLQNEVRPERTERMLYVGHPPHDDSIPSHGSCEGPSYATIARMDSARCGVGNVCFSVPSVLGANSSERTLFECPDDWNYETNTSQWIWSDRAATWLSEDQLSEDFESRPWALELANGEHCMAKGGGTTLTFASETMAYWCYDPDGDPDTRWSDQIIGGVLEQVSQDSDSVFAQYVKLQDGSVPTEILVTRLIY